jgi:UrcA family protein
MQTKTFAAAVAPVLLGAVLAAGSAFAAPAAPTLHVSYADLNLSNPADARTMLHRIRQGAASVCAAVPGGSGTSISAIDQFNACYRTTVSRAVASLGAPAVTQAYNSSGRDSVLASR